MTSEDGNGPSVMYISKSDNWAACFGLVPGDNEKLTNFSDIDRLIVAKLRVKNRDEQSRLYGHIFAMAKVNFVFVGFKVTNQFWAQMLKFVQYLFISWVTYLPLVCVWSVISRPEIIIKKANDIINNNNNLGSLSNASGNSLMYNKNRTDPSTEPCGTPA